MNLIFDLGGVLVTYDRSALVAEVFSDSAAHDRVHGALYADLVEVDRGTLTLDRAITQAAARTGVAERDVAHIFRGMSHRWVGMPQSIDLLYRLKDKGHRLFCLSNMGVDSIEYLEATQTFWDAFEGIVISCRVGLCKPEPQIFAHVLQRFALTAAETVFIDDVDVNVEAVARAGIHTIRFEDVARCERELRALECL